MLENINLTLSDDELKKSPKIKSINKLSMIVYIIPLFQVLFWSALLFYIQINYHKALPIYQFILDHTGFFKAISLNLGYSKEQFITGLTFLLNVIGQTIIPLILLCFIIKNVYKIISLMKTTVIVDDMGVWVKKGLFKFTKEASGVVWNNADLATSKNGIIYYIFKNYPLMIKNRFSGAIEISLPPIKNGKALLEIINKEISKRYNDKI